MSTAIKSFVGGHEVAIYRDCTYDPAIRKYRGGRLVAVIPYGGRMLSAQARPQQEQAPIWLDGQPVPVRSAPAWASVDPIPPESECAYALVSTLYVSACREMWLDTSRLLTVGGSVVDSAGNVIGAAWLNRN